MRVCDFFLVPGLHQDYNLINKMGKTKIEKDGKTLPHVRVTVSNHCCTHRLKRSCHPPTHLLSVRPPGERSRGRACAHAAHALAARA